MNRYFDKDPDAVLDFKFDWKAQTNGSDLTLDDWLANGETIASYVIDADSGITVDSHSRTDTNTSVTAWLSGGTAGMTYSVACKITTSSTPPRVDERTIIVRVRER